MKGTPMSVLAIDLFSELHEAAAAAGDNTNRGPEERAWRALQAFAATALDEIARAQGMPVDYSIGDVVEPSNDNHRFDLSDADDFPNDFSDEEPTKPGGHDEPPLVTKNVRVAELELALAERDELIADLYARINSAADAV